MKLVYTVRNKLCFCHYLVVQFYLWFKLYFSLCWGTVMFDNEFDTMEIKIKPRIKLNHDIYNSILNY